MNYTKLELDVLIIGAGGGGLRAAIELEKANMDILVVGKRQFGDAHTVKAAGGINAALKNLDPEDSWKIHAADTLREGHFVNDPKAVELLCKNVPNRVKELQNWGCNFNLTEEGKIDQRYFGAQSFRRTCFVGDRTGKAIEETLVEKVKGLGVSNRENLVITKILTDDGKVFGAVGYDRNEGEFVFLKSKAILLAAGGYTEIYKRSSSRPHENTGDGPALAFDAGAELQDMEMVQFHPTGMVKPEEKVGSLVTEAVRGEGGRLFNDEGERFMKEYSPKKMELDARDQVARAIYKELEKGKGTDSDGVYLDISHEDSELVRERLPAIVEKFASVGVDPTREKMEVAPTTHYSMGGVRIDFETGETKVDGLFAVGEVTAGLHGANRLGGNSLAEVVTFGKLFSKSMVDYVGSVSQPASSEAKVKQAMSEIGEIRAGRGIFEPSELLNQLGEVLWTNAGIVRDEKNLKTGLEEIREIRDKARELKEISSSEENTFARALELKFALPVAEAIVSSALKRTESRGAHYRSDNPEERDEWRKNIVVSGTPGDLVLQSTKPDPVPRPIKDTLKKGYELEYHHLE
jgi:succinate dehydrogenase / fumarate reductase flavoprotein subunit